MKGEGERMKNEIRRGKWGVILCCLGIHKYQISGCRGIPGNLDGVMGWFIDSNFYWKCGRCGKVK